MFGGHFMMLQFQYQRSGIDPPPGNPGDRNMVANTLLYGVITNQCKQAV